MAYGNARQRSSPVQPQSNWAHRSTRRTLMVLLKFLGSVWSSKGYAPTSITNSVTPQLHTSAVWPLYAVRCNRNSTPDARSVHAVVGRAKQSSGPVANTVDASLLSIAASLHGHCDEFLVATAAGPCAEKGTGHHNQNDSCSNTCGDIHQHTCRTSGAMYAGVPTVLLGWLSSALLE